MSVRGAQLGTSRATCKRQSSPKDVGVGASRRHYISVTFMLCGNTCCHKAPWSVRALAHPGHGYIVKALTTHESQQQGTRECGKTSF